MHQAERPHLGEHASGGGPSSESGAGLRALLPAAASVVETFADDLPGSLFPEEEALVAAAVVKRKQEFATGRRCAHAAMARLGVPPAPLLTGPNREPLWPDGIVGSITHCAGYRAAAVARGGDLASIGIDAEPNQPTPRGVLDLVALPAEHDQLAELAAAAPAVSWDRMLFSAKESVYKAWFPLARRWLGFTEAEIAFSPAAGTFTAKLLVPGPELDGAPVTGFTGRFTVAGGVLVTAIAVVSPAAQPASRPDGDRG
jgi:enterobactin synthetase component D / holo-[acyl-carrier protein] synthase